MTRTRKGGNSSPFVMIPWDVLNSKAYKELPPSSAKALPYFLVKPGKEAKLTPFKAEFYNHHFAFPYREAKVLGFASGTFATIIQMLVRYGFIDPVERGGKRSFGYSKNVFKPSWRWKDYGKPEFKVVEWYQTIPKLKASPSPKCEIYRIKNGKEEGKNEEGFSNIEAVRD
jgi:hypothetical protein